MSERIYPVRDPLVVEQMDKAFLAKVQKNKTLGQTALTTGEFKPYAGVAAEAMAKPFYLALEIDTDSAVEVIDRVALPMQEIAEKYGLSAIFTGLGDLPPHISLNGGLFENATKEQEQRAREWMDSSSSHVRLLAPILTGLTFHMDTLVVAPNSYVCPSRFTDEQGAPYRSRKIVDAAMTKAVRVVEKESRDENLPDSKNELKLKIVDYSDIFHMSVARITDVAPSDALLAYGEEVEATVGLGLRENPLVITTSGVYMGRPLEMYLERGPQLLNY